MLTFDRVLNADEQLILGEFYQDDIGAHWQAIQEIRQWEQPTITRLILKEQTKGLPRPAIVRSDGTEFACQTSPAVKLIALLKVKDSF